MIMPLMALISVLNHIIHTVYLHVLYVMLIMTVFVLWQHCCMEIIKICNMKHNIFLNNNVLLL